MFLTFRPTWTVGITELKREVNSQNLSLRLPCSGFRTLDNLALQKLILGKEDKEEEFLEALNFFAISTAAELIRTIEGRQFEEEAIMYARYKIESPSTHLPMWHMFAFEENRMVCGLGAITYLETVALNSFAPENSARRPVPCRYLRYSSVEFGFGRPEEVFREPKGS